jgi:hypothetical protein
VKYAKRKSQRNAKASAVNRVPTASLNLSNNECEKDLNALLEYLKALGKSNLDANIIFGMPLILNSDKRSCCVC